jgi:ATP-binding cassette subfamily B protein|tara:strand:- start:1321 stop:3105 length:1785 start_codon:yes stop_codon:yes gene_type:complete
VNKNIDSITALKKLFTYITPWRKDYYLGSLFSFLNKIFDIAPEILIGVAVDLVVKKNDSFVSSLGFNSISSQVFFLGAATFIIWALESTFEYLYLIRWRGLAQKVEHSLRVSAYDHAQKLDISWHESKMTGDIAAVLNDDINQLEKFLNNGINQIIQVVVSTISIGIIFFYISPLIASIAILPVPIIFFVSFFFQKRLSPIYKSVRDKAGLINSSIVNNLLGIQTIKSFMTYAFESDRVKTLSNDYQNENLKAISINSAFNPIIRMGVLAGFLGTILIGSTMALNGTLAVGAYSVLVFLTQRFLWPFTSLSILVDDFERSMASCKRIFDLMDSEIKIKDTNEPKEMKDLKGDIEFKSMSFNYPSGELLFENFTATIPFGSSIGIVGDTGSGKTTIAKLLLRLYDPINGSINISGCNVKDIPINRLREKIGIVSQETFLFNASIKENISYGMKGVKEEDIVKAANDSHSIEFINSLKDGFNTMVGERGQKLSGGQKQRLAIARAIIRNPDILIFDEATSSVDNKTEQSIQQSFLKLKENRTIVIIAHRLSTIRNCDNILVIRNSNISEKGTHDELIDQGGFYSQLWNIQTGEKLK